MIKNIFTEIFREQYERQESLFKSHKGTILSIINLLEKQNFDFSESLNTFQSKKLNKNICNGRSRFFLVCIRRTHLCGVEHSK